MSVPDPFPDDATTRLYLYSDVVFDVVRSRDVVRRSVAAGQLTEEDTWMRTLADRRRTSHEYDEQHLIEVTGSIREKYAAAVDELAAVLASREARES